MPTLTDSFSATKSPDTSGTKSNDGYDTLSRIVGELDVLMGNAVQEIHGLNERARMLSFNAKIEAGRAGGAVGAAFGVVARAMQELSETTSHVADGLRAETREQIRALQSTVEQIATEMQGERLVDMALTNIDLIDRNLYERTCDVRWWATDSAIIDALVQGDPESRQYASRRMGVILDAYTVYFDLVIADRQGRIVCNGRPNLFRSEGQWHDSATWFQSAIKTTSVNQFGFEGVHDSPLVGGKGSLVYSCGIRPPGQPNAPCLGVLGVVFDWKGLSQTIVEKTKISDPLLPKSHVAILDESGKVLADIKKSFIGQTLTIPGLKSLFQQPRGFAVQQLADERVIVAHAQSPGFETFSTGWHSVIIEPV
ncbi:cache domain-containing protein [bacterium]|nr:cache domain-containing protein [bacterium]